VPHYEGMEATCHNFLTTEMSSYILLMFKYRTGCSVKLEQSGWCEDYY